MNVFLLSDTLDDLLLTTKTSVLDEETNDVVVPQRLRSRRTSTPAPTAKAPKISVSPKKYYFQQCVMITEIVVHDYESS